MPKKESEASQPPPPKKKKRQSAPPPKAGVASPPRPSPRAPPGCFVWPTEVPDDRTRLSGQWAEEAGLLREWADYVRCHPLPPETQIIELLNRELDPNRARIIKLGGVFVLTGFRWMTPLLFGEKPKFSYQTLEFLYANAHRQDGPLIDKLRMVAKQIFSQGTLELLQFYWAVLLCLINREMPSQTSSEEIQYLVPAPVRADGYLMLRHLSKVWDGIGDWET